ncbi:MAG: thioredoxin family protein [Verrucomicrobiota bacterium]
MKKIALSLIAVFSLLGASAAELEWLTDLTQAKSQAKAEKKLVLMDFTGSDWCPPCKKLKKDVFSSEEFATFAKANLVLVEVDFPRTKKQSAELKKANEALSRKYDIEAYPTIIVLSPEGKQLIKDTGYDGSSAKDFVAKLEKVSNK